MLDKIKQYAAKFSDLIVEYSGRVILAIIVLLIGLWVIKRIVKAVSNRMEKRDVDESLRPFLRSLIDAILKVMLFISVASMLGVEMTSFVAVLGAAGLAIGLALQGSLANFAGGVLILLLKPFKVGDYIDTGTHQGTVREIQIFYTYITTFQNQEVIIPNGDLSNNAVKNYSYHDTRRLDMLFGIGYGDNMDKAKGLIEDIVKADERVLDKPPYQIFIESLGDSSVNIKVRMWTKNEDYWNVWLEMSEKVKKTFDSNGVSIPFPQRDVHLYKTE
jgi:small conductance mechanosensitive channel